MATTTNFGWETPDDTDLVKDGALAMRTLGNAIDASLVDLKGGTTGQVLSKTSNTDMDFTWVTSDDANAIQNAIVDAKGDLITATAADTPARLAVGSNGDTLVADSAATTGLRWQGNYAAGKNKIINGDFGIWQRGTSISYPSAGAFAYIADRFNIWHNGSTAGTVTASQQTFTPGTAPVSGYEGAFFCRVTTTTLGSGQTVLDVNQRIEDVRTFAGQTVTLSFWLKSSGSFTPIVYLQQNFGSGGSSTVDISMTLTGGNTTTNWQRYTATVSVPSISGKTIGTSSFLNVLIRNIPANGQTIDIWGVQLEAGSVATAFQTATGTLQGELALAQRYYQKSYDTGTAVPTNTTLPGVVSAHSTSVGISHTYANVPFKVEMRTAPTVTTYSYTSSQTSRASNGDGTDLAASSCIAAGAGTRSFYVYNNSGGSITPASGGFLFHYAASAEL